MLLDHILYIVIVAKGDNIHYTIRTYRAESQEALSKEIYFYHLLKNIITSDWLFKRVVREDDFIIRA